MTQACSDAVRKGRGTLCAGSVSVGVGVGGEQWGARGGRASVCWERVSGE